MKKASNTVKRFFELFPPYVWICLAIVLAIQFPTFYATRIPIADMPKFDISSPLDRMIPFVPQWVIIYFLSFPSWLISAVWIMSESKEHCYRFSASYISALLVTAAVFMLFPCTMERPEITGTGFFDNWMRFVYSADSPTNLCPSLHVMVSFFVWRGTEGCKRIPMWYKVFNFVFLILVCMSILLVKQHVIVDIPAALIIGEACIRICSAAKAERIFWRFDGGAPARAAVQPVSGK